MTTWIVAIALSVALYLLPSIVASCRRHRNTNAIEALNILLGWTFLGWVVALVWALTDNVHPPKEPGKSLEEKWETFRENWALLREKD